MSGLDVDTIAAVATPPGMGGVSIVRISGPAAAGIGRLLCGAPLKPRLAAYRSFRDGGGDVLDEGVALFFRAPRSFTGEDVLELQGHGGPVVVQRVLEACLDAGARMARPGEFSERAFLNGKLDLAQAEAVADLIGAASVSATRAALRSLTGSFSRRVDDLAGDMLGLRVFVEAVIDFPEEELDLLGDGKVKERIRQLHAELATLLAQCRDGALLNQGIRVAITGAPNVGKSSLLNVLSGQDAAIVTDVPGTTRDLLKVDLVLEGLPVTLVDTAGLRDTEDPVEGEGVRRARAEAGRADLVLVVCDVRNMRHASFETEAAGQIPTIVVANKADLGYFETGRIHESETAVCVSAKTGAGIGALIERVKAVVGFHDQEEGFTARTRHVQALREALSALDHALVLGSDGSPSELIAEELRVAHDALGSITGTVTTDDLLGEIFSTFCVGK